MRVLPLLALLGALVLVGCGKESKPAQPGENPLNAPADYVGAALKAQQSALKTVGTASLNQAIKTFAEQENRYPTNLNELVSSGILPKLPAAPTGMKFDYDPATGSVKVVPEK